MKTTLFSALVFLSLSVSAETIDLSGVDDFYLKDGANGGNKYLCFGEVDPVMEIKTDNQGRVKAVVRCTGATFSAPQSTAIADSID